MAKDYGYHNEMMFWAAEAPDEEDAMDNRTTARQRIDNYILMLQHSGQDTMIEQAVRDGETLAAVTATLAGIWDVDAEELYEAANVALLELQDERDRIENSLAELNAEPSAEEE